MEAGSAEARPRACRAALAVRHHSSASSSGGDEGLAPPRRWRNADGKTVENADLWRRLSGLARQHDVEWRWVRGHADAAMNLRADRLAVAARGVVG